jgi:hypothetical protein
MTKGASSPAETAALTDLLRLEFGVIYGLSAGAGQLATHIPVPSPYGVALDAATASFDQHRLRRDRLIDALVARSAPVPTALAAYQIPRSDDPARLLTYLASLGQSTTVGYRNQLAQLSDPVLRTDALDAVIEAARFRTTILLAAGQDRASAAPALPG